MPRNDFFKKQNLRVVPKGIGHGSSAAHRLSSLIGAHVQRSEASKVLKLEGEANDCVYLVLSGWICVSKSTMDGSRLIIDVLLPGNIIDAATADAAISAVEIETLTDVTYAAIPRRTWLGAVNGDSGIGDALMCENGAALSRISERMLRIGKGDAESIIAFALCELCLRSTGLSLREVDKFQIPMTQQQLGDFCGLSSVHICRTLRRFKRNGVLDVRNHMEVTIHDVDTLADIAQINPEHLRNEIVPRPVLPPFKVCG